MKYAPLPDYKQFKRVLFIGPHPDDIEIGAGATARKLVKQGAEVFFLIATDGGAGTSDPQMTAPTLAAIRKEEAKAAGDYLGVKAVEVLDFPDGGPYDLETLTTQIVRQIILIKPDAVFAPDPMLLTETHPDHLKVGEAARRAVTVSQARNSILSRGIDLDKNTILPTNISLLYFYSSRPNIFIPIKSDELEAKFAAINLHKSQIDASFEGIFFYLDYKAKSFGKNAKAKYAEGFYALGPVHQHCFTENI